MFGPIVFSALVASAVAQQVPSAIPATGRPVSTGSLRQIVPGHYLYISVAPSGRSFNSGIVATSEGVLVLDALGSEVIARSQLEAIASDIKRPVRYLVSSTHHDNYTNGNVAYRNVFKIGHEHYRSALAQLLTEARVSTEDQAAFLPDQTFHERVTLYLGGKEIQVLYLGRGHTRGDSIVYVPEDRIAYLSELFFSEQFPNMVDGYGVAWLETLNAIESLDVEIFVPGHGPLPANPRDTRQGLRRMRQIFVDARDGVRREIARGATEDQAVASVTLEQYAGLPTYESQREILVRRMYQELTGTLQ
jgi:glyoxylase-like metal-dependent hydrolase (beta-lactamase superfamily II)